MGIKILSECQCCRNLTVEIPKECANCMETNIITVYQCDKCQRVHVYRNNAKQCCPEKKEGGKRP